MTPNEARYTLNHWDYAKRRRDVIGKVARAELREACAVLSRHSLELAARMRQGRRKAAHLETAAFYRQAYAEHLEPQP